MSPKIITGDSPNRNGGLCECGCGVDAPLASYGSRKDGWVKGKPIRFLRGHHRNGGTPAQPVFSRMIEKIFLPGNGCWVWTGQKNDAGYGKITVKGKPLYAHRVAYELWVGNIPADKEIDHLCNNKSCINFEHLETVTHQENIRRGYQQPGVIPANTRKTHCPQGHPYDATNTYFRSDGGRTCKICRGKNQRAYVERNRIARNARRR